MRRAKFRLVHCFDPHDHVDVISKAQFVTKIESGWKNWVAATAAVVLSFVLCMYVCMYALVGVRRGRFETDALRVVFSENVASCFSSLLLLLVWGRGALDGGGRERVR